MTEIRKKTIEGLTAGVSFSVVRTFTEADVLQFAGISKDYNPIHFDEGFALLKKFPGRICHGLLVAAMITEIGGQIGWLASAMEFRFRKPVFWGDTITCRMTITGIDEQLRAKAEAVYTNQYGEIVIEAALKGIVPGDEERKILQETMPEDPA
jgi:acyl dehydratase